ncbi:MAG: cupredoxin domain-containing protein [Methanobacteriota archaeon]
MSPRIVRLLALVPLVLALAAGIGEAHGAPIVFRALDADGRYWFAVEGLATENPTIEVAPGAEVAFVVANAGQTVHNLHVGAPLEHATDLLDPGADEAFELMIPTDAPATIPYWCDPHRTLGMEGVIRVRGVEPPADDDAEAGSPGLGAGLLIGAAGLAAFLARRR